MSETLPVKIEVGDQVRVHFHPPGPMKSFSEGVVSRVDVTAPQGRFFVVEVTHEVILDREHRLRPGFQDYVRYEGPRDFPGRVEVLSTLEQGGTEDNESGQVTEMRPVEVPDETVQGPDAEHDQHVVRLERQEVRRSGGLIAAFFGRQK
ncbi:hypothetical protein [Microvirga tunisiensis]|uniref:hypothetical protein n=1 Tax=Microvirga tunisiensis TaxID=2108360 RepID=UPI00129C4AA0|nr:hypothetical protein [Microvirga tunisiensis]